MCRAPLLLLLWRLSKVYHKGSVLGPILFSLFVNDLPLHVKIYLLIVTCWQITLHTSEKEEEDTLQIRSNVQDSLDQVSNWCDSNHMVINPIKTKSMTLATGQKHQPSSLPLYPVLRGAKTDHVSEHRFRYNHR